MHSVKKRNGAPYRVADDTRISLYVAAGDREGRAAVAWARKRWKYWMMKDGTEARSVSTLLRDLLVRAYRAERLRR
jgi:hypothetical protein